MMENTQYKTDPEFDVLIQPYDKEGISAISQTLIEDESKRIIHVWQGTYIMNHSVFNLLNKLGLSYITKNHSFAGKSQAVLYICLSELKRTDLTPTYKKFLIGREFYYRNIMQKNSYPEEKSKCRLSTTVGIKYGITGGSVTRYSSFSESLMDLYSMHTEMALLILLEKCKASYDCVREFSRLKPDEINAVYKSVLSSNINKISLSFIRSEACQRYVPKGKSSVPDFCENSRKEKPPAIRQMPVYDPDADVNSLCLTIGYWITSMQRVNNKVDFKRITTKARIQLMRELSFLENTIGSLQESLVERTDA